MDGKILLQSLAQETGDSFFRTPEIFYFGS